MQEEFVVTIHEVACEQEVLIPAEESGVLLAKGRVHSDNKPWQTGLNHDYIMTI